MKKIFLLIAIWFNVTNLIAQTIYSKEVEAQIKQVENSLAGWAKIEGLKDYNVIERMAFYKVKGLSIAVVQNYKVVWAKGYGWADEKEKRPVTPNTLFEPGSISKSLNAVGILKLVQDKKLDLYTDINTYLKSWKFPYDSLSENKKITLANLLSHSAGLNVHGFPGYDRKEQIPTVQQVLDGKAPANTPGVRSEFTPGLKFQYSGGGTTISQLIIIDATQQPYDKFMYENVLKPMGMTNSFYSQPPPVDKLKMLATGYNMEGDEIENKFHIYPEQAAAGLWMTPSDLCNYIIETQLAYEGKSSKVLTPEMTKLRLTPYADKSSALGVFIEEKGGTSYFQHGAGNEGFRGQYYGSLEGGNGVAVFVNSDNGNILPEIINSVATVYNWKGFYEPVRKKEIYVPDSTQQKYVGLYTMATDRFVNIVKKEDGFYQYADGTYDKMHFTSETDYFNLSFPSEKSFIKDASGNVTGYMRKANGGQLFATRILKPDTLNFNIAFFKIVGWNLIENKNIDEAFKYLKRGAELYPGRLQMEVNLAHCYLFKNDYDSAINIYKAHIGEMISPRKKWEEWVKEDFVYFKKNKYETNLIDKAFADLKWEIPEGYKTR